MPTASRTARCSAAWSAKEPSRPQPSTISGGAPSTANHSGYSQPEETAKCAPAATSRSWITDRRTLRAVLGCQFGQAASAKSAPSCSTVRSARKRRLVSNSWVRSMPRPVTSTGGTPSTIHRAIRLPTPPLRRMPSEFIPAATKKPPSSGASPSSGPMSSVKLSGPQNIVRTPASCSAGMRSIARAR